MTETTAPRVRTGQGDFPMSRDDFDTRFRARFADPAFANKQILIDQLMETACDGYQKARKSPVTQKAGEELRILPTIFLSIGSRLERPSAMLKNTMMTRRAPRAFCSFAQPPATIKPVQARCQNRFGRWK